MKEQIDPQRYEKELLRFVMPVPSYSAELARFYNGCIRQYYTHVKPLRINILEQDTLIPNAHTEFFYILGVEGRNLKVISLTETTSQGEQFEYYSGYPFIKLPPKKGTTTWSYEFCEDTWVNCRSEFVKKEIEGVGYDALTVTREFLLKENEFEHTTIQTEWYIAGKGISIRESTTWQPQNSTDERKAE